MFKHFVFIFLSVSIILGLSSAGAHDYRIGKIIVDHPTARATPPGASVAAGYLSIENTGNTKDRLIGGSAAFAKSVEVHEMKMEADVMKMRQLKDGLPVTPGNIVKLEAGGYHIMFMGLKEQLKQGEKREVQLTFEKAGTVDVVFKVKSIAETMKKKHSH